MNYYGYSLPYHISFGSPKWTYCLNSIKYYGVLLRILVVTNLYQQLLNP